MDTEVWIGSKQSGPLRHPIGDSCIQQAWSRVRPVGLQTVNAGGRAAAVGARNLVGVHAAGREVTAESGPVVIEEAGVTTSVGVEMGREGHRVAGGISAGENRARF
jgi:hypothetical protein